MESPQKIGKFRILRLLGQGAMGQVFLAEDPLIDRRVAIKVMAAEGDDEARERFRNEARTAGQLSHPNIVQLYEFGFHLGQPYLVMEYLVGESLDLWLARGQPMTARLSVLLDLCRAIGHAHSRGVLHRDVKPSNLQVLPDGACKLMDFGIARSHSVHLTATGTILGTPEFIAPEVLQDAGYSDRSDLFAVGLVAYQVLAGVSPFRAASLEGCITRVLTYEPPPLAEGCTDVPAELSDAVSSYLCKHPKERPADVRPLMAALQSLQDRTLKLESAPTLVTARPATPTSQPRSDSEAPTVLKSRAPARKLLPAAVLPVAVLAAAGVLAATLLWRPWSDPDPAAEITANLSVGVPPAVEIDAHNGDSADTPLANAASPATPPPATLADSSSATVRGNTDPEPATDSTPSGSRDPVERGSERTKMPPSALRPEQAPEDAPAQVVGSEPDSRSPPDRDTAGSPATTTPEGEPTTDRRAGETAELPDGRSPAVQDAPEATSTAQPKAGEASGSKASAGEVSAGEAPTGEPALEPSGVEPSTATPRIDRLEPMVVRRGSNAILLITGSGFDRGARVMIRRGGRPVRALRVRSRIEDTSKLRVTLLVDRQFLPGTYMVTVVDAGGRESNPVGLEVGL